MKLRDYLKQEGLSYTEFAKVAGISRHIVIHAIHGRSVGLKSVMKIEKATQGAVKALDLFPNLLADGNWFR